MTQTFIIAGTGTGIGKTVITTTLCHQLRVEGKRVHAFKPVMSGFAQDDTNSDAALILKSLGIVPSAQAVAEITPWGYIDPLPPHLAARKDGKPLVYDALLNFCREQALKPANFLLMEGAGGILSPLTETHTLLDLAMDIEWPLIVAAGSYLGAISHTLTAIAAIRARGAALACVIVSASAESPVTPGETAEAIRAFAGSIVPVYTLPRLQPGEELWKKAPPLAEACFRTS